MSTVDVDDVDRLIADDRKAFERLANKAVACGLNRSRRGTYVNPSIARDWKWFDLGLIHARVAQQQSSHSSSEPVAPGTFPARILALLRDLADRDGTQTQGPAEDGNGEPLQDDADAALAWIAACHQTQAGAAAMVATAWEQVEHRDRMCDELRAMLETAPAAALLEAVDGVLETAPCDCSHKRRYEDGEHMSGCHLFDLNLARLAQQAPAPGARGGA